MFFSTGSLEQPTTAQLRLELGEVGLEGHPLLGSSARRGAAVEPENDLLALEIGQRGYALCRGARRKSGRLRSNRQRHGRRGDRKHAGESRCEKRSDFGVGGGGAEAAGAPRSPRGDFCTAEPLPSASGRRPHASARAPPGRSEVEDDAPGPHDAALLPLGPPGQTVGTPPSTLELRSSCRCGRCSFAAPAPADANVHPLPLRRVPQIPHERLRRVRRARRHARFWSLATTIAGRCSVLGDVERVVCSACSSKLATRPRSGERAGTTLLALGCVEDERARRHRASVAAHPLTSGRSPPRRRGGRRSPSAAAAAARACSAAAAPAAAAASKRRAVTSFRRSTATVASAASARAQPHKRGCRCARCDGRRADHLKLVRTTGHGQRHMCTQCHGVMSIIYDSQPDCAWPVAGALDDDSIPDDLGAALSIDSHLLRQPAAVVRIARRRPPEAAVRGLIACFNHNF